MSKVSKFQRPIRPAESALRRHSQSSSQFVQKTVSTIWGIFSCHWWARHVRAELLSAELQTLAPRINKLTVDLITPNNFHLGDCVFHLLKFCKHQTVQKAAASVGQRKCQTCSGRKRHLGATKYDFDSGYMAVGHTHNHLKFLEQQTKWTNDVRNFLERIM